MTSIFVPPTTGKKKARARRVFGDAVVEDEQHNQMADNSISMDRSNETMQQELSVQNSKTTSNHSLSYSDDDDDASKDPYRKSSPSNETARQSESNRLSGNTDLSMNTTAISNGTAMTVESDSTRNRRLESDLNNNTTFNSRGPFDKIIASPPPGTAKNYAGNEENLNSPNSSLETQAVKENSNDKQQARQKRPTSKSQQDRLRQIRLQQRSPLRRDLVKATQAAINQASQSVNQSLRAAQRAKEKTHRSKKKQTQRFKRDWQSEAAHAKSLNEQTEATRRQVLGIHRQISSKFSQEKASQHLNRRQQQLDDIERESQFKSQVFRDHQRTLQVQHDAERRNSIQARAKLRQNHVRGTQKLTLQRIQEDQALYQERHERSLALELTKQTHAAERRASFVFRRGDARRIRELHADRQAQAQHEQHLYYEDKWGGEKDAAAYQEQLSAQRRQSLARRNADAHRQREQQMQQESDALSREHASYELKWAGERDAAAYQEHLAEERRQSLAQRNAYAHRQRAEQMQDDSDALAKQHASFELKWAGERDAAAYQEHLAEERRQSFAQRNAYAHRQREKQMQDDSDALVKQHASFELKWAGERDAAAYQEQMAEERRRSLAERNVHGHRQREEKAQRESDELAKEHDSYELKWAGERDAAAYHKKMAEERRKSLEHRNAYAHGQRNDKAQEESDELAKQHASYELKWAGERDATAYKRQMAEERRQSFEFRNRERVRHAQVMEELRTIAREQETESLVLKWAGERDAKAYLEQMEEERRQSLQRRGRETVKHRQLREQESFERVQQAHCDELLKAEDQRKVTAYLEDCAARDRLSLEFRRKEARLQRLQEQDRQEEQHELDARNFELESAAHSDVEEYIQDCRRRRRLSLAFRARETRRHAAWRKEEANKSRDNESDMIRSRLLDQQHVELARQQERVQEALRKQRWH